MLDLPRKEATLDVDTGIGGVVFTMATLTDEELFELLAEDQRPAEAVAGNGGKPGEVVIRIQRDRIPAAFAANVRGAKGLQIDGEDFDPSNQEHLRAVKPLMKAAAVTRLVQYEINIPKAVRKNSKAPAGRSRKDTTPSGA